jgi:hypothetical protein
MLRISVFFFLKLCSANNGATINSAVFMKLLHSFHPMNHAAYFGHHILSYLKKSEIPQS